MCLQTDKVNEAGEDGVGAGACRTSWVFFASYSKRIKEPLEGFRFHCPLGRSSWPPWKVGKAWILGGDQNVGNEWTLDIFWRQTIACDDNLMARTGETESLHVPGWSHFRHSCDV